MCRPFFYFAPRHATANVVSTPIGTTGSKFSIEHRGQLNGHGLQFGIVQLQPGQLGDVEHLFAFEHLGRF